jgi:hypothetical protein
MIFVRPLQVHHRRQANGQPAHPQGIIPGADGALLLIRADGEIVVVRSWQVLRREAHRLYPRPKWPTRGGRL